MFVRFDNQIAVAVNGEIQYRSYENEFIRTHEHWHGEQTLDFKLELDAGENVLSIGAFRMGLIGNGALNLETLDMPMHVSAPLKVLPEGADRVTIEAARDLFHPTREWFYPNEPIRLVRSGDPEIGNGQIHCSLVSRDNTLASTTVPLTANEVILGTGADMGNGSFEIHTQVTMGGHKLNERTFQARSLIPSERHPGVEQYESRRIHALEHIASGRSVWAQVARYALGRPEDIDPEDIESACVHIDRREDCSDFVLHPLLRLIHTDRDRHLLPEEMTARITASCLNFRYWSDEPGSDCLVMGTENHRILFHTAEFLAGTLWPHEVFPNSGMTGAEHVEKGRGLAENWLQARMHTGFSEWHSNSYYPHSMAALLDLYDCAPANAVKIRSMAKSVLTACCFNLAADSFEGSLVTTHGRIYTPLLKVPGTDGVSGLIWLLYGDGYLGGDPTGIAPLALGGFRPPDFFSRIADDKENSVLTKHHQGNDSRFIVYRTPDYLMSVLQDYRPGEKGMQVHPFQLTFRDKVTVFFSCPQTAQEGDRPDYWSGNAYLPRAFGERNVAVLLFKAGVTGWMSHCYFEPDRFDETCEQGNWILARKRDGYVGIWSENGSEIGSRGQYAGRERICRHRENAWVVEAGRREDWGPFENFVGAIMKTDPHRKDGKIVYSSPSVGTIQMGWEGPILLNGEAVDTDYPLLDSTYGHSEYGSGKMLLRYGDKQVELTV